MRAGIRRSRGGGLAPRRACRAGRAGPPVASSGAALFRLLLALSTVACVVALALVGPADVALDGGFRTPVIALELARTPADLAFVTGPAAAGHRAQLWAGQRVDVLFPFAYAGLLAAGAWQAAGPRPPATRSRRRCLASPQPRHHQRRWGWSGLQRDWPARSSPVANNASRTLHNFWSAVRRRVWRCSATRWH